VANTGEVPGLPRYKSPSEILLTGEPELRIPLPRVARVGEAMWV